MQRFALNFDGVTTLKITIELVGHVIEESVILDTGYTSPGGHGLSLPIDMYHEYIQQTNKKINVKTGHDERQEPFFPDTRLIKIRGYKLRNSIRVPTVIMGDAPLLGVMFLQHCTLHLNGPRKSGYLEIND